MRPAGGERVIITVRAAVRCPRHRYSHHCPAGLPSNGSCKALHPTVSAASYDIKYRGGAALYQEKQSLLSGIFDGGK
jgi:hypothetical protein